MTQAYPLHWPHGRPRASRTERSRFATSFASARDELFSELYRMNSRLPVLSTNVSLRRDGLPYANQPEPDDRGVAVYFEWKGRQMSFSCDRWDRVKDNVQAIRLTIAALRGLDRWGTGDMMEAAFTGFEALPAPDAAEQWWEVLGVSKSFDDLRAVEAKYRLMARDAHPDNVGSHEDMTKLNVAIEQARKALS